MFVAIRSLRRTVRKSSCGVAVRAASTHQFVRDVYKQVGYSCSLTSDSRSRVLSVINGAASSADLVSAGVPKLKADLIFGHRTDNGDYECVEQLLDVKGFEPEIVEKMAKKIVKVLDNEAKGEGASSSRQKGPSLLKHLRPSVDRKQIDRLHTVIGMKFNLTSISYANISPERGLKAWNCLPLFDSLSGSSFHHHKLYCTCLNAVNALPEADLYVFEENPGITARDPYLVSKIHLMELQATLTALLNKGLSANRVVSMNCVVLDSLFGLRVGTERVAIFEKLPSITAEKRPTPNSLALNLSGEDWDLCLGRSKREKEQMANALLVALAFRHLLSAAA